jgi:DNA primase
VVQSIAKIPDPIVRSVYAKEAAKLLEMEEELILSELNHQILRDRKKHRSPRESDAVASNTPFEELLSISPKEEVKDKWNKTAIQEKELLRILVNYGFEKVSDEMHVCEYLLEETKDLKFETPVFQRLLDHYKSALRKGILPKYEHFLGIQDETLKKEVISLISQTREISVNWELRHQIFTSKESDDLPRTTYRTSLSLKRVYIRKMMTDVKDKLKEMPVEQITEIMELQKVYMELKSLHDHIDGEMGTVIPPKN